MQNAQYSNKDYYFFLFDYFLFYFRKRVIEIVYKVVDRGFRMSKGIGDAELLQKRIPRSARYRNVPGRVDTGNTIFTFWKHASYHYYGGSDVFFEHFFINLIF